MFLEPLDPQKDAMRRQRILSVGKPKTESGWSLNAKPTKDSERNPIPLRFQSHSVALSRENQQWKERYFDVTVHLPQIRLIPEPSLRDDPVYSSWKFFNFQNRQLAATARSKKYRLQGLTHRTEAVSSSTPLLFPIEIERLLAEWEATYVDPVVTDEIRLQQLLRGVLSKLNRERKTLCCSVKILAHHLPREAEILLGPSRFSLDSPKLVDFLQELPNLFEIRRYQRNWSADVVRVLREHEITSYILNRAKDEFVILNKGEALLRDALRILLDDGLNEQDSTDPTTVFSWNGDAHEAKSQYLSRRRDCISRAYKPTNSVLWALNTSRQVKLFSPCGLNMQQPVMDIVTMSADALAQRGVRKCDEMPMQLRKLVSALLIELKRDKFTYELAYDQQQWMQNIIPVRGRQ